jgi:hypothetical protein
MIKLDWIGLDPGIDVRAGAVIVVDRHRYMILAVSFKRPFLPQHYNYYYAVN